MTLTFADIHNMIAYLTKSDASEGFNQIINFLNGSSIKYALTVNPNIYVSCIKQFWTFVAVKKVNDVTRLQALVDKKKVVITEATIRDALRLDDAEGVECLPNEEIFAELARMGYEKPSTKLVFYKAFFSSQWKFLIHTILQCTSAKRTSWNEFSFSIASAVICLSTDRKFNFSKYIFDSLVRNVDSSTKFYMYPSFLQLMIRAQVETPLFEGMIVEQHVGEGADEVHVKDVSTADVSAEGTASVADDEVLVADKIAQALEITKLKQRVKKLERRNKLKGRIIIDMDTDKDVTLKDVAAVAKDVQDAKIEESLDVQGRKDVTLKDVADVAKNVQDAEIEESSDVQGRKAESQAQIYQIDLEHADKVLSMQDVDIEPAELQEVVEVVTTAKLITEVVSVAAPQLTTAAALILTTAPSATRRRKGVVIRDPKESATPSTIIHTEAKSKDKGKGIMKEDNAVKRYQALKRKPQTEAQAKKNMMIYLRNTKEQMDEEDSRALKRLSETQEEKSPKKQKLDEEVTELKRRLQLVPNDEDDVYTEATPLARKVPVVDYEIYTENNKPYYKIKRADGSHQLYLSFLSMLRNFDREDLEVLWQLVKERFASTKPKNFSDDFLLITLGAMFEKPDVQAQIWKNQRSVHGQAKVKS
nr:hypothetical protein [Tanacetum cinerariifolium]